MLNIYHPEMKEERAANTQIDASLGHYGKHYFLRTALVLKGRGIVHLGTETAETLVPNAQHLIGQHKYKVTIAAFEKLCETYSVSVESLLS